MKALVIAESRTDAVVIRTLLAAKGRGDIVVVEGGGKSPAISLGTSFALQGDTKVAIVVDADTTDVNRLKEQQSIFEDLQRRSSGSGVCRLFLAVPTLEGELFPTADDFASIFNLKLTPHQRGRYENDWNRVVRSFLSTPDAGALPTIRTKGVEPRKLRRIFEKPLLRELTTFLNEATP